MKIISSFIVVGLLFCSTGIFGIGLPNQSLPGQFNYEFNEALKYEWRVKIQATSGLSLFEEARQKVQSIKNTQEGTKTTELIYTMGNNDFCRGFSGACDETSLHARLIAGCETARNTAMEKMDSNFIKNNTAFLIASYTSCYELADDVLLAYKDAASIEVARWNGKQSVQSQEKFTEKTQDSFQKKVSNTWDVFKKKWTNFVRSVQGITRNVNIGG